MKKNIEIEEAFKIFESSVKDIGIEKISISKGLGYILAEDIFSPINQPPFSKSAMDGVTLNSKNLKENFKILGLLYFIGVFCGIIIDFIVN